MISVANRHFQIDLKSYFKAFLMDLDRMVSEFHAMNVSENIIPFEKARIEQDAEYLQKRVDNFVKKWRNHYDDLLDLYFDLSDEEASKGISTLTKKFMPRLIVAASYVSARARRLLIEADATQIKLNSKVLDSLEDMSRIDGAYLLEIWVDDGSDA